MTVDTQNNGKLNRLLADLGDTHLVSSRWLRSHGYANRLVARYVSSGWLVSPARSRPPVGCICVKAGICNGTAWFTVYN